MASPPYRLSNGVELPLYDDREASAFELPNGMRCVVVSDKHAEVAACSVQVSVGHFSDPDELPGLAHFLEHMLFMGTSKYPCVAAFVSPALGCPHARPPPPPPSPQ
jgi:secreted Zn-dependent insulinase-like peptidase